MISRSSYNQSDENGETKESMNKNKRGEEKAKTVTRINR